MVFARSAKLSKQLVYCSSRVVASNAVRQRAVTLVSKRSISQSLPRTLFASALAASMARSADSTEDLESLKSNNAKLSTVVAACGFAKSGRSMRGTSSFTPSSHQYAETNDQPVLSQVGQAGEDAFFVANDGMTFGISDGVGGWGHVAGSDSAAYSRNLMRYAMEACNSPNGQSLKPVDVLQFAYDKLSREHQIIGSATACIASFDPQEGMLHYANLGDSGLLLVRSSLLHEDDEKSPANKLPASPSNQLMIRAEECQHTFNCPYQLGSASDDRPSDSCQESLPIFDGDLLIVATDGFWDNLHDHEVLSVLRKHAKSMHTFDSLNDLARQLALEAYQAASSPTRVTPFAQACRQAGKRFYGGKMDDITVIVAQFVAKPGASPSTPPSSGLDTPSSDSSLSPRGSAAVHPADFRHSKM